MDNETRAKLDALPLGHPIRAGALNIIAGEVEFRGVLVATGLTSQVGQWFMEAAGSHREWPAEWLTDVIIPEVAWPPGPLPTVPCTVIIGDVYADMPNHPTTYRVHLMRTDTLWLACEPGRNCYMVSECEISNWRVVYAPRPPDTDEPAKAAEGGVSYGC